MVPGARRRHAGKEKAQDGTSGVVIGGERLTVREWSERTDISANVISSRLNRGWTPGRMTRATEKKEPAMKTIGKAVYTIICLALLAATIIAQSQGWTTTFYLAFLAVATPGATMWAWRHLMRA